MGMANFIERDFDGWADLLNPGRLLRMATQVNLLDMLGQHNWRLSTRFKDPRCGSPWILYAHNAFAV